MNKYVKILDKMITKGIYSNDTIYRISRKPIEGNILKNFSSWGLIPMEGFCDFKECHLYVTKIPNKLKVLYLENLSKDKDLDVFQEYAHYEYEYLLPRNLEFKELKTKTIYITSFGQHLKDKNINSNNETKVIVHYIKIIKKIKNKELPIINQAKIVIPLK